MAMTIPAVEAVEDWVEPITLRLEPVVRLSDDEFRQVCELNAELWLERTATGEIEIMPPAGPTTSHRNLDLGAQLAIWARQDGTGLAFDATGGFVLPNGAIRAPDASWVRRDRLRGLNTGQDDPFLRLCPDFAVELRSRSDRLGRLQAKMDEYVANGCRLAWLIDPWQRVVHAYRPGQAVARIDAPDALSADPELPGFVLDLAEIWRPLT
jgi:Uma2 family endonuclease